MSLPVAVKWCEPLIVADVRQDYPHFELDAERYQSAHIRSILYTPIIYRRQAIRMIALDSHTENFYQFSDSITSTLLASAAASAIENARLVVALAQQQANLRHLLKSSTDRDAARAFRREIEIVQALPAIGGDAWESFPRFITMGRDRHGYYYVQSYIPGQTLAQLLAAGRPPDALTIVINLCRVLRVLHAHGIIHGDVHPQNIIVGRYGEVALIDFGLSRYRYQVTPELRGIGRPVYTPPEQLAGWPLDERSDFFALGGVLCDLLDVAQLPATTQHLIERMLDPFPANRRITLAALQAELEAARYEPLLPQPPSWVMKGLIIISIVIIALFYLDLVWR